MAKEIVQVHVITSLKNSFLIVFSVDIQNVRYYTITGSYSDNIHADVEALEINGRIVSPEIGDGSDQLSYEDFNKAKEKAKEIALKRIVVI